MTGDECPGGKSVFQITFLFGPNCAGNPVLSDTPVPFGPRNCDHSSASVGVKPNEAEAATMMVRAIFIFRLRIVIRMSEDRFGSGVNFISFVPICLGDPNVFRSCKPHRL